MTANTTSNIEKETTAQHHHAMVRPLALFLDGMSRAVILPFGPALVYRLVVHNGNQLGLDCSMVAYPLAVVVAAYLVGKYVGNFIAQKMAIVPTDLPKYVARLSGAAIALHVFTLGAGLNSVWWLVVIRFLSATILGVLCSITKPPKEEATNDSQTPEERMESGLPTATTLSKRGAIRRDGYFDLSCGTAKIYMTAYAVSILSGGLLYRHATFDVTFQALTGSYMFTLSPLFLITVSITAERILRCMFRLCGASTRPAQGLAERVIKSGSLSRQELPFHLQSPPRYNAASSQEFSPQYEDDDDDDEDLLFSTPLKHPRDRLGSTNSDVFVQARDRLESAHSAMAWSGGRERFDTAESEFFDCNSVMSDMDDFPPEDHVVDEKESGRHDLARYVNRRCLFEDGTPAFVPHGDHPDRVPPNYLTFCGGNMAKAKKMWIKTQLWRQQQNVWRIHTMPNRWFKKIKEAYPHFAHGVSKQGYPIIYEQPGKMNLKQLFRNGCDVADMVRHYTFFMEYVSNCICTKEEVRAKKGPNAPPHNSSSWGVMVVMDIKGAGISHLSGDVLTYLKQAGDINSSYYPLSMKRAFLVNSPFWLAGTWSTVKSILPDSVQVEILSSSQYQATLREYIDEDQIPQEYGGTSPYTLGEHPFEVELGKLVEEAESSEDETDLDFSPQRDYDTTYSYDHNTSSWKGDQEDGALDMGGSWRSQLSRQASSNTSSRQIRRRAPSCDIPKSLPSNLYLGDADNDDDDDDHSDDDYSDNRKKNGNVEGAIFIIVSVMYGLWSASQGVIETAIPFWMLIPTQLGGLGYAPSRSGVALFCSIMMLLWFMRTKFSRVMSQIPSKAPMRSFRIGVGSEAVLLSLLVLVPKSVR